MRAGVIGSGSWATAFVKILHENLPQVQWYIRNEESRAHVARHGVNPRYLRSAHFQRDRLVLPGSVDALVRESDVVFVVVPSAYVVEWLEPLKESLKGKLVVPSVKGIIPGRFITVTEYLHADFGVPYDAMGVVSGPCHAEEVAQDRLSYLTVACKNEEHINSVASMLKNHYIRAVESHDIYGVEYSAILKNIYAVAVGIAHGLNYGDNFQAVLTCNAQAEILRFLQESYPYPRSLEASVYLGDLLVTCYSSFSRNRTFGTMVGRGYGVRKAQTEMEMVAEGYYAAQGLHVINQRHGVEMPIADAIYRILYEEANPAREMQRLTERLV